MAASTEREAEDVCGLLVPAGGQGVGDDVSHLRKNLLYDGPVGAQAYPLAELRSHVNQHAFTLSPRGLGLLLSPPALQLSLQSSQLEEGGLLIEQGVFLHTQTSADVRRTNTRITALNGVKY